MFALLYNSLFFCPHSFSLSTTHHRYRILRNGDLLLLPPLRSSWDIQVKVPFTKARHWTTLPPGLEAHFALRRICVCLEPLGSRLNSKYSTQSAAIGKSTVWGGAKVVWQNCYLLSPSVILSLWVNLKGGVSAKKGESGFHLKVLLWLWTVS